MKITLELYRDIQDYIRENFENTSELDYSESEVLSILERPYIPGGKFVIPTYLRDKSVDIQGVMPISAPEEDDLEDSVECMLSVGSGYLPADKNFDDVPINASVSPQPSYRARKEICTGILGEDEKAVKQFFDDKNKANSIGEIKRELLTRDEGFREMLFRKIDEKGMTDAQCYKRAQLSRSHFNKIKNDKDYNPKKQTVVALGMALELSMDEFSDFVSKAGYSLSRSNAFDLIIRYAINKEDYDVTKINQILYYFDQQLLGAGFRD